MVTITSVFDTSGNSLLGGGGSQAGQGSGFVVDNDGHIVTNAHVVTSGGHLNGGGSVHEAKQVFVEFGDRNRVPAQIVGFDADADVALIKVDPSGLNLQPVQLSDRSSFTIGEPVAAIGSPFGEDQSLSIGVVSATNRTVEGLTNFGIDNAIQTDASINPGNSGGPLLDSKGQVIGINEQIASSSGSNSGVGFAIPVTSVRYSLDQLKANGKVEYAFLGVTSESLYPQLAEHLDIDSKTGALITDVVRRQPGRQGGAPGIHRRDDLPAPARQDRRRRGDRRRRQARPPEQRPLRADRRAQARATRSRSTSCATVTTRSVHVTLGSRPADVQR